MKEDSTVTLNITRTLSSNIFIHLNPRSIPDNTNILLDQSQEKLMQSRLTMIGSKQSFVYLRDDGETTTHVWKQYEFILCDKLGEPRHDLEGNPTVVIGMPLEDLLTKPDERGNMKRARIIELINKSVDDLEKDPTRCQFKIAF